MSDLPKDLKYNETHEWVRDEGDGTVTVGITDYAQEALGDLVFVELPGLGDSVQMNNECAVVESVKAASDIYSPVSGEVLAVNEALSDAPEIINQDVYGDGWMFKVSLADPSELEKLLDADGYAKVVESEQED